MKAKKKVKKESSGALSFVLSLCITLLVGGGLVFLFREPLLGVAQNIGLPFGGGTGGQQEGEQVTLLSTTPRAGDSYLADTVFVGDSRTEGLMLYTGLSAYTTAYADKGLTVSKVFSEPLVKQGDKTVTVDEALRTAQYNKCYIMLGINELGWPNENVFISHYEDIINAVKESHPDAKIYVQSILPVSASKSEKNQNGINNERINKYNQLLLELSEKTGAYYLDTAASVKGEDGTLPESATSDGIHLNKQFCTQWLDYLKNHTVQ